MQESQAYDKVCGCDFIVLQYKLKKYTNFPYIYQHNSSVVIYNIPSCLIVLL